MVGTSISHYRILRKLGAGGMGEVFEAEDTQLGRRVALKVLPDTLAAKPEGLQRFKREARALATLNHPNIVSIFSVEEAQGHHFITMERVEGRPLSDLIPDSGFSLEKLFNYAIPVADALASAHQKGIGHRDLKPSNVMVNEQGRVKVIDFGLAKLFEPDPALLDPQQATVVQTTECGQILGTPSYMSPEQIEGRTVDHRTDIFSFGILLSEMATGQRPFKGHTPAAIMSSVLRDPPPPLKDLKPELPEHLGRIARHCLQKDPDARYQSALDVRNELKALQEETQMAQRVPPSSTLIRLPPRLRWGVYAMVATVCVLAVLGVWRLNSTRPASDQVAAKNRTPSGSHVPSGIPSIQHLTTTDRLEMMPAFSPDGRHIAFVAPVGDFKQVFIREPGTGPVVQLTQGDYDHLQPAWGPDTNTIYYAQSSKRGTHPSAGDAQGASYMSFEVNLVRHDLVKGEADTVVELAANPTVAPGGADLFFVRAARIWRSDLLGGRQVQMSEDGGNWEHTELRVAVDGSKLVFRRFNIKEDKHEIAVLTTNHVMSVVRSNGWNFNPAWHPSGDYIYFSQYRGAGQNIWRLALSGGNTAAGEPEPVTVGGGSDSEPAFSPDGKRMVFSVSSQNADVYRVSMDPATGRMNGLPIEPMPFNSNREDSRASWAPSVEQPMVAFNSDRDGDMNIYIWREKDNSVTQVTAGPGGDYQATWSPDLQRLTFWSSRSGNAEIYVVGTNANSTPVQLTHNPGLDVNPFFSPDGKRIVFASEREGRFDLYTMNADGSNQRRLVKNAMVCHFNPWFDNESVFNQVKVEQEIAYYRIFVDGRLEKLGTVMPVTDFGGHSSFSPDHRSIMELNWEHNEILLVSLTSTNTHSVYKKPAASKMIDYPWWSPDGRWGTFDLITPRASQLLLAEWQSGKVE